MKALALVFLTVMTSAASWRWSFSSTPDGQLHLTSYRNGVAQFDYGFGAGGSIQSLRYVPGGVQYLVQHGYANNDTDGVIQSVFWLKHYDITNSNVTYQDFNINQAGDRDNHYSITQSVRWTGESLIFDVVAPYQWLPSNASIWSASVRMRIEYETQGEGVLTVHKKVHVPAVYQNGAPLGHFLWSTWEWIPFKPMAVAYDLSEAGRPTNIQSKGSLSGPFNGLSGFEERRSKLGSMNGYMIATNGYQTPSIAIVYGKPSGDWRLHQEACQVLLPGVNSLSQILEFNAHPDQTLEFSYDIIARPQLNSDMAADIKADVDQITPAGFY